MSTSHRIEQLKGPHCCNCIRKEASPILIFQWPALFWKFTGTPCGDCSFYVQSRDLQAVNAPQFIVRCSIRLNQACLSLGSAQAHWRVTRLLLAALFPTATSTTYSCHGKRSWNTDSLPTSKQWCSTSALGNGCQQLLPISYLNTQLLRENRNKNSAWNVQAPKAGEFQFLSTDTLRSTLQCCLDWM